jgi:hypothetical protein
VFIRGCPLFPAQPLSPGETLREHPTRVGIEGLRHKSRHKSQILLDCPRQLSRGMAPAVGGVNVPTRIQKKLKNLDR